MMLRQAISRNGPAQALPALNPYGTAAKVVIDHLRHLLKALDELNHAFGPRQQKRLVSLLSVT